MAVTELHVIAWDDIDDSPLPSQYLSGDIKLQTGLKAMIASFPNVTKVHLEWILSVIFEPDAWMQSKEEKLLADALRSSNNKDLEVRATVRIANNQGRYRDGPSYPASWGC